MRRALLIAALLFAPAARADDETDRLRDALRHVTIDLRAAQDAQTTLQASLDQETKQNALLRQQVAALNAKVAATPAAPATPAVTPAALQALQAELAAARGQNAALRGGLSKWQAAYGQAAAIAQAKDRESRDLAGTSTAEGRQLALCRAENTRLTGVANDILHLYRSQGFRSILLGSYEPLIGFEQVKLENIVQDYEDKIRAQAYLPTQQ
jgi:predicted  nucleic acid-binding Zn-ribbon protein